MTNRIRLYLIVAIAGFVAGWFLYGSVAHGRPIFRRQCQQAVPAKADAVVAVEPEPIVLPGPVDDLPDEPAVIVIEVDPCDTLRAQLKAEQLSHLDELQSLKEGRETLLAENADFILRDQHERELNMALCSKVNSATSAFWLSVAFSALGSFVLGLLFMACLSDKAQQSKGGDRRSRGKGGVVLGLLLAFAGTADAQVVTRNVEVGTQATAAGFVTGWYTLPAVRNVDATRLGGILADIESRMPPGHGYSDSDLVTWAHETTHGINSRCRVSLGARVNCFYCLNGHLGVFREPRLRKSTVCQYVPPNLRGDVWSLYMAGQQEWDDTPLYVLDEWIAYINGAAAGQQLYPNGSANGRSLTHDVAHALEFSGYASALMRAIDAHDPSYPDRAKLASFIGWNIDRTLSLAKAPGFQGQIQQFAVAYFQGGYGNCVNGQCGQPQWSGQQWSRQQQMQPARTVQQPTPQPPMVAVPPKSSPANCACKNCSSVLLTRIEALEKQLANLPSGPKGDSGAPGAAGPQGIPGPAGSPGLAGKDGANPTGLFLPVTVSRPGGGISRLIVPLDNAHELKLGLGEIAPTTN